MPGLEEKLDLKYPVFQAPMAGGIVSPEFVAKVCNFGVLGSIASGYLSLDQTRNFIDAVKAQTSRAFSLNLFVDYNIHDSDTPVKKPDEILAAELAFDENASDHFFMPAQPPVDEFVQLAIDCAVPVVSATFGFLEPAHVVALKSADIKIMTTVNCVHELEGAIKTQSPDVLVYQNALAGGHKGGSTSLPYDEEAKILEAMKKYPDIHCVVSGGIVDKKDVDAALANGFDGVQIGTAFLATQESSASEEHKAAILNNTETIVTTSITGRSARGLANRIASMDILENPGFPFMHYATANLRKLAKMRGDTEYQSLWCGDGISRIERIDTLDNYMNSLVS